MLVSSSLSSTRANWHRHSAGAAGRRAFTASRQHWQGPRGRLGTPSAPADHLQPLLATRRGLLSSTGSLLFGASMAGGSLRAPVATAATTKSEIEKVLDDPRWPERFPFREDDFLRYDETPDTQFYSDPRFVFHIDEPAIKSLTKYYAQVFPPSGTPGTALLDICSSWVSHYPPGYAAARVAGLGMNAEELARNEALTEYAVHDLNEDPRLPYADASFDVVTNCVSVDYLNKPLLVFREIHRVLKPGGTAIMSFSNRCFPTKAIALWTATGDADHVWIVGSYFHYSVPDGFTAARCKDITPVPGILGRTDPMYVVYATKTA